MKLITHKAILYPIIALAGFLASACNGDIFVDPIPDFEVDTVHLECNGAPKSFIIPTKGLTDVKFSCDHGSLAGATYYDNDGNVINDPTLSDIGKVVYYSPMFCIDFSIDGDRVTVNALDNTTKENVEILASLVYAHYTKPISFIIAPGQPLQITEIVYFLGNSMSNVHTERLIPHTYNNNSTLTQRIVIYPYKETQSKIKLQVDGSDFWACGVNGNAQIPYYSNGEWHESQAEVADVTIGDITDFYSPGVNIDEAVTIEVPPQSKVTTVTEITYQSLDANFVASLRQPGSGYDFSLQGRCSVMQPVSYKIEQQ